MKKIKIDIDAKHLQILFGMVGISTNEESCMLILDVLEAYEEHGGRLTINHTSNILHKHKKRILDQKRETGISSIRASEWDKLHLCSARLRNILMGEHIKDWDSNKRMYNYPAEVLNINISKKDFMSLRNAGEKSWKEFVEIRGY